MTPSHLQIDNYVFRKIFLESFDTPDCENWQVDTTVNVSRPKDDTNKWFVELAVSFKASAEASPYTGEVIIIGVFRTVGDLNEEAIANLVNVNGPTILYSSVREMVLILTSRGPHRPVLLPSVAFIDRKQKKQAENKKGADNQLSDDADKSQ